MLRKLYPRALKKRHWKIAGERKPFLVQTYRHWKGLHDELLPIRAQQRGRPEEQSRRRIDRRLRPFIPPGPQPCPQECISRWCRNPKRQPTHTRRRFEWTDLV